MNTLFFGSGALLLPKLEKLTISEQGCKVGEVVAYYRGRFSVRIGLG